MTNHRFILQPYKGMNTRFRCPACQARDKTFTFYIDMQTGEHLHPTVGRCNRESKCGYHYTPKQYFQDNKTYCFSNNLKGNLNQVPVKLQPKPISFISMDQLNASLKGYETNNFVRFLTNLFGSDVAGELVSQYFIGTSKHWNGATVFWQIDLKGKIRTAKIMLYNSLTGKRIKEPFNHITWVHKVIKQPEFELQQCLFGEHLLQDTTKTVAIVESEKTAIIASVYLPQFIWLAVGSLTNLNSHKCKVLAGRNVVLYPDLNAFDKWTKKTAELKPWISVVVSDLLEKKASLEEREKGLDIADFLIRFNWQTFRKT